MSLIPILQVGNLLLVTIQTELHDRLAEQLQDDILQSLSQIQAEGVVIDITGVETVDSFIGRVLSETARMVQIMGTRLVLVGMQPAVTISLLELGLAFHEIETAMDVEAGIELLGFRLVRKGDSGVSLSAENEYGQN